VLTEGFQSAFAACVVLAGIGVALALLLPGRPRKASRKRLEPVPATGAELPATINTLMEDENAA
jgi:hypothetical protein